jgi:hypothetical protein
MSIFASSNLPLGIQIYASALDFPSVAIDGQQAVDATTNTIYIYQSDAPAGWKPVANPGAAIAIDALTGDVTATGPGVVAATVAKIAGNTVSGTTGSTNVVFSNSPTLSGTIKLSGFTGSQILALDASSNIQSLTTATYPSLVELSYVKGVTSSIQTQFNNKQPFAQVTRITKSSNYNIAATDDYIGCSTVVASFTLTLPAANTVANGKKVIIKDEGGAATAKPLSVTPTGTDKIDGANATQLLNVNYESITVVCNGVDSWFII